MRVLVVDDYPGATEIGCVLVRLLGHDARGAQTGAQALEEVAAFAPEVIILDLGLPDINGFEVAREVRARVGTGPFIAAMTGWDQPDMKAKSLAAGIDMHVLKPASADNLTRIFDAAKQRLTERGEGRPT